MSSLFKKKAFPTDAQTATQYTLPDQNPMDLSYDPAEEAEYDNETFNQEEIDMTETSPQGRITDQVPAFPATSEPVSTVPQRTVFFQNPVHPQPSAETQLGQPQIAVQTPQEPTIQQPAQPSGSFQVQREIQIQPAEQPAVAQSPVQIQTPVPPQATLSLNIQPPPAPVATSRGRKAPGTCPDGLIGLSVRIDPALYARLKLTAYRYNTKNAKVVEALIRDYCPVL